MELVLVFAGLVGFFLLLRFEPNRSWLMRWRLVRRPPRGWIESSAVREVVLERDLEGGRARVQDVRAFKHPRDGDMVLIPYSHRTPRVLPLDLDGELPGVGGERVCLAELPGGVRYWDSILKNVEYHWCPRACRQPKPDKALKAARPLPSRVLHRKVWESTGDSIWVEEGYLAETRMAWVRAHRRFRHRLQGLERWVPCSTTYHTTLDDQGQPEGLGGAYLPKEEARLLGIEPLPSKRP